jgi:hypothetical protein
MSCISGPCLPADEGSGAATRPMGLCGPHKSRIKKCVAGTIEQLASHVPKMHAPDSAAVAIKANAFPMRTRLTSVVVTIKVRVTCR